jgi:hypothetical protein
MENNAIRRREVNPERAHKGYTLRRRNPYQALRMFENREDMDLYQFSDLLLAKFGKDDKQLTVKALKAQLHNMELFSNGTFNMEDYRIEKRSKFVFPHELCCILLPLVHFNCISGHTILDANVLLAHYETVMNYISKDMDEANRDYLYTIPAVRNYADNMAEIKGIFDETKQMNSLMLHLLPQNSIQQLSYINKEIRSLRQRCYIANLTKSELAKAYVSNPYKVVKLLNHMRTTNNEEPSDYPGLDHLLKCLTTDNIDDVLMHYFIYKSITQFFPKKDTVTRDELFMFDTIAFHALTYPTDIPEYDKDAVEHLKKIQLKAGQMFDRDDPVEHFLYEHILDMAKLLLFTKGESKDTISTKAKALYSDALKTKPGYLAPNDDN